jgi:hypothetical protein
MDNLSKEIYLLKIIMKSFPVINQKKIRHLNFGTGH